jgi:hypothetical protein
MGISKFLDKTVILKVFFGYFEFKFETRISGFLACSYKSKKEIKKSRACAFIILNF